jgi:hypothetical protein
MDHTVVIVGVGQGLFLDVVQLQRVQLPQERLDELRGLIVLDARDIDVVDEFAVLLIQDGAVIELDDLIE